MVNDLNFDTKSIKAEEITETLLKKKMWLFNSYSPNIKYIIPGDKVILYLAGAGRKYFYASFIIDSPIEDNQLTAQGETEKELLTNFTLHCKIRDIQIFAKPVPIFDVKEMLKFITNKKYYGLFFRQSIRTIDSFDFEYIINKAKAYNM